MREVLRVAWLVLRKDIRVESRSREVLYTTTFFAASCVLVFSFAFVRSGRPIEGAEAGIVWVALAYAGQLALGRAFERELHHDALRGLLLAPVERGAIFAGKLLGIVLLMALVEVVVVFFVALFFSTPFFEHGLSDDKRRSKSLAGLEGLAFKAAIGSKRQSNPFVAYLPRLTLGGWIGQQIHDREAPPAEEVVAGQSLLVRKFFQNWSNDSLLDDRWSPPADLRRLQTNPRSGLIGSGSSDYYPAGFKSEHLPLPAIVAIDKASNSLATNCTPPTALKELMTSALVPELDADRTAYRRWMLPVWQNLGWRLDGRIPSEADTLHACGDKPPQISLQSQGNCRQQCRLTIKLLAGSHELWRVIVNDGDEALSYDISGRSAEIVHLQQGRPAGGRLTIEVWDQALYRRIHFFDPD